MPQPTDDYDTPWKDAISRYFPEFMAFYFPLAHAAIDWRLPHRFLDKELAQVARDAELGKRLADQLVEVATLDGAWQWVLLHVEVQGGRDSRFAERIFTYNYRLYDRYRRPVASLALLADGGASWRPAGFGYRLFGCAMRLRFPVVKLSDYADRIDALLADPNPFALVTAAHLLTKSSKGGRGGARRSEMAPDQAALPARLGQATYHRSVLCHRLDDAPAGGTGNAALARHRGIGKESQHALRDID